ncbi:MAG TPA: pyridoxamine 5'-phosphate oxidase family protein [Rubrobacteraceae bacterium]|nr:pyridoxamine 5'-phosphate oxidase family protein [Rubrobacteraceae bacterium]
MSVFTPAEIEYLRGQSLGRLATVGPGDQPHVIPVTFWFNADEYTIDIGGINFAAGKKWRDPAQPEGHFPRRRHARTRSGPCRRDPGRG